MNIKVINQCSFIVFQVYLVDFGLAFRYKQDGKHKELKVDPRTAHNGTIEYTSTDAHNGISQFSVNSLTIFRF